ncbi:hypothetical protein DNI29_23155 [Hymenobacter sediminis]|uniref:hypothetical protein n=1 Tax=Hymenobacter sediminis TaxID=2218621 RepID=UPI000DA67A53|nr:hypothetical protein [Hymenobacter sediminis]RPD43761.1 hypothetical protein DNI29_23155 [Hymenobacter sediminis]
MGELRASLYDIFGYFLPGLVATAGLRLLLWVIVYPTKQLSITPFAEPTVLLAVAVIAYLVGHLLHAIGNEIRVTRSPSTVPTPKPTGWRRIFARSQVSATALALADQRIEGCFGTAFLALSPEEKAELLDEARVLHERVNEREVYIYREGFYRGMTVACVIVFIALLVSLRAAALTLTTEKAAYAALRSERLILTLLVGCSAFLFWKRMLRFAYYKTSRALMLWLATSKPKTT